MKKIKQKNNYFISIDIRERGGFTLIELMVASSIFAIVMLILIGALMTTFGLAKNSRAMRLAMDNVNYAMESMTRSIRMGTNYTCVKSGEEVNLNEELLPKDCPDGGTFLAFIPQRGASNSRVGYQVAAFEDNGYQTPGNGNVNSTLRRYDNINSNTSGVPIVSSNVNIEKLNFFVEGSDPNDGRQASVYIIMKGTVDVKGVPVSFSIQTLASQRNF